MAVKGLLRQMIGAYIARPDPVGWLAAADWLEEQGRDAEARLWRRRGMYYMAVLSAYERTVAGDPRTIHFGGLAIDFHRKEKTIKLAFRSLTPPFRYSAEYWLRNSNNPGRYLTRNIIWLIDRYAHRAEEQ